jgi:hypothetical protein
MQRYLLESWEQLGREVQVKSSYSWSPMWSYVVGHYQFQWELDCRGEFKGDEVPEMLSKGMASSTGSAWNGKIVCKMVSHWRASMDPTSISTTNNHTQVG